MKNIPSAPIKRSAKSEREQRVLFGLIDHFILTGRPVGSQALQEAGFEELSSATIRNYFASLEDEGLLAQQHTSGGRIPTAQAYRLYAQEFYDQGILNQKEEDDLKAFSTIETKEIVSAMQKMADEFSRLTGTAVFLGSPRFDHDTILDVKVVLIDSSRLLIILITDFGSIHTETLYSENPLHQFAAKRIENYFRSRLLSQPKPENIEPEEEKLAQKFYNEVMVRYLVSYSHFTEEELYKTGFSRLLNYPEFHEPAALASGLTLFENQQSLRLLLRDATKHNNLRVWIEEDLISFTEETDQIAILTCPYSINGRAAGAIGLVGPCRVPYRRLFGMLRTFSASLSKMLTNNLYKFKISAREPSLKNISLDAPKVKLLENKKT